MLEDYGVIDGYVDMSKVNWAWVTLQRNSFKKQFEQT